MEYTFNDVINFDQQFTVIENLEVYQQHRYKLDVQDMLFGLENIFRQYKNLDHFSFHFVFNKSSKIKNNKIQYYLNKPYGHLQDVGFLHCRLFDKNSNLIKDHILHNRFVDNLSKLNIINDNNNSINLFSDKGARKKRLSIYQQISDNYAFANNYMQIMKKNFSFFNIYLKKYVSLNNKKNSEKVNFKIFGHTTFTLPLSLSSYEEDTFYNKSYNINKEYPVLEHIEKMLFLKLILSIVEGFNFNHFEKVNFNNDYIYINGKNKNLELCHKIIGDFIKFSQFFGYGIKEKMDITALDKNNYLKIVEFAPDVNKDFLQDVKYHLSSLVARKERNAINDELDILMKEHTQYQEINQPTSITKIKRRI